MEIKWALPPKGFKRLFYDLETSPNIGLFWKSGYKLQIGHESIINERAIICACYKWEGQKKVHSLTWDKNQCDKQLLIEFMKIVEEADEVVAHNGDRFDEKWIRTRCLKHGISCPPRFKSLDTLKKARSHFNFNSNRLDYIGKFLKGDGKIETHYGLWKDILLKNCTKSMKAMVKYCKKDVELLEDVYHYLRPYITHNSNASVATGGEKWACPNCGSEHVHFHKRRYTATGIMRVQMQCQNEGCKSHYTISNKAYMAKMEEDIMRKALKYGE